MFGFLRRLFGGNQGDAVVLNLALDMAQDWGADFGQPVLPRLRQRYPWLSDLQLQGVEAKVQTAMKTAHATVAQLERTGGQMPSYRSFCRAYASGHAWVDGKNLRRLYTQGCYFAAK